MAIGLMFSVVIFTTFILSCSGLKCYECDNGNALSPNFSCPAEGNVIYGKKHDCSGKCFIRTRHGADGAVVERGCFQKTWMKAVINNGCDVIDSDIWCFCDVDDCNGKRLGDWFPITSS